MQRKLILINPVGKKSAYQLNRYACFQPLGLGYVAALTPQNWEIKIIDENFEPFSFEHADLVGITAYTATVNRAYEIAKTYREKGIPVVLGGIHASMVPDEAARFVDVVVTGEVEDVWPQVIADAEAGKLQSRYTGQKLNMTENFILPRNDLFHPNYLWHSVQTSRGCPFNCKFCCVSPHLGREYRYFNVEDVLYNLESIKSKYILFTDDNLIGYDQKSRDRARALFTGMIERKLNKRWWMQISVNVADDPELIALAAKAGCMFALIGFESVSRETLQTMNKNANLKLGVKNYRKVISLFHRNKIGIIGAFIIGNDYESEAYYKKFANFLKFSGVDIFQITILTPLPGTKLMEELENEGRLTATNFPTDWGKYRFSHVLYKPKGLSEATVYQGNNYIKNKIYSFPWYHLRLLHSLLSLKKVKKFGIIWKVNQSLKKGWEQSHYYINSSSKLGHLASLFKRTI